MKTNLWILILVVVMALGACSRKEFAKSPVDTVFVLSNDRAVAELQQAVDTVFSYGMRTPEFEPFFTTCWQPLSDFKNYMNFKNLVVIADLNGEGLGRDIARLALSDKQFQLAESDSVFMFAVDDFWAIGQTFILIAGKNFNLMRRNILEQKGWLYEKVDTRFMTDQEHYIYHMMEEKKITRQLWERYKWTIRVPHDYVIVREDSEQKFVWLGRSAPYRWLSVTWEKGIQTEWLTPNGLFNKRNEIGQMYQNIQTNREFLGHKFTHFGDRDVLKMTGLWHHETEAKGGPFITYAFYDSHSDRTFVIDMMMFSPGAKSVVFMRQVEIVAKTFTTRFSEEMFQP